MEALGTAAEQEAYNHLVDLMIFRLQEGTLALPEDGDMAAALIKLRENLQSGRNAFDGFIRRPSMPSPAPTTSNLKGEESGIDVLQGALGTNCPTAIPEEAKHHERDKVDYWTMPDRTKVGPDRTWWDKGKSKPRVLKCYNNEGIEHGPGIRWHENGQPATIKYYENGKLLILEERRNDGKRITTEKYIDNKLVEWIKYDSKGDPREEWKGTFILGTHYIRDGTVTKYLSTGGEVVETWSNRKVTSVKRSEKKAEEKK